MRATGLALALVTIATLIAAAAEPPSADAYKQYFKPITGNAPQDPCAALGIGPKGGLIVRPAPAPPDGIRRWIALLCGPVGRQPFGTVLVDDQIRTYGGGSGRGHQIQGGLASMPWNSGVSTKLYPYIKGPKGFTVGLDQDVAAQVRFLETIRDIVERLFAKDLPRNAAGCMVGLPEIGVSCVKLLTELDLIAFAELGILAAYVSNFLEGFILRFPNMNNSNWFYWSNAIGAWNSFGDVDTLWINPSITIAWPPGGGQGRIGVVFSNVAGAQGPDFPLPGPGSAQGDATAQRLAELAGGPSRTTQGRQRIGTRGNDRLAGTRRSDFLHGRGRHDLLLGRGGGDILLQGGRGNDVIHGGGGADNIDGLHGHDALFGGAGDDAIVDLSGDTFVEAGPGVNVVAVRDGQEGDLVSCRGSRRNKITADPGDVIGPSCRVGRSRIVLDGPLPKRG